MKFRQGLLAAGNWIVDQVKIIDAYPEQDKLANISEISLSNGGSPYNVLKDLALLGADFPLEGAGFIGQDAFGEYILEDCKKLGIQTQGVKALTHQVTSITDVMTVASTGRRTFFHARGANSMLTADDVILEYSDARIFHLGYLLLLDGLDCLDEKGRTGASHLLEKAKKMGFLTSADVVSEASDRFSRVVVPSLPFIDYLFVNEYEAEKITGIPCVVHERLSKSALLAAAQKLLDLGINSTVFLHFPTGALALEKGKSPIWQGALQIPSDKIKGAAGAGDAFAAGVLLGLHDGFLVEECLKLGVLSAASSLFHSSCSAGILQKENLNKLAVDYPFRKLSEDVLNEQS